MPTVARVKLNGDIELLPDQADAANGLRPDARATQPAQPAQPDQPEQPTNLTNLEPGNLTTRFPSLPLAKHFDRVDS